MSKEMRLGVDVQKLDNIVVPNYTATACLGKSFGRNDLPMVVGIIVAITRDLLTFKTQLKSNRAKEIVTVHTLTTYASIFVSQRVLFYMRMKEHF